MQQAEIHQFLERYFTANDCELLENHPGYLTVQLTIDMDKELMNRPFYWHYLEKTGGIPNPAKLTIITDKSKAPDEIKGEMIHFGAPRLHQIFQSTKDLAGYIRLYEETKVTQHQQRPLYPWLGVNIKVSYQCDRKRDIFRSFGLNMINGALVENFQKHLLEKKLTPKIPDLCFTLSPIIMPKSGVNRIESYLQQEILGEDHSWAEQAKQRWEEDLALLDHFYEDLEEKPESYFIEKEALREQYEPVIKIEIINGGLFYLNTSTIK
ncbi:YqhG family protein [Bacillus sp. FJAT-49736]|uniref:YqhG family protein n=1 Tax=Bacillus sp. FJAT-49736 TaxID=2833582 RepID=UPI001BC91B4F|nr:YqhG family protein [Bacillus sp. FJAT-49736]MBS4173447.1 YqhG family protein [Bacillus sp. FJAT-49736]